MRDVVKLALFLLVISGIAGFGVSFVHDRATPLIEEQARRAKIESFKEVYPQAERVENESSRHLAASHDPAIKEVNIAYRDGAAAGVIYAVETKGYSGPITVLAGFDIASARITAIKVLSQSETPGLGAKAKDKPFMDRYRDKESSVPLEVTKTAPTRDNQIQAITASTITSKAVTKGVNAAREHFRAHFVQNQPAVADTARRN